ncbi:hypothetical protein D3C77_291420 [compost metagenome]
MIRIIAGFIPHGPDHDRRMILIALHHTLRPFDKYMLPLLHPRKHIEIAYRVKNTVAFQVRFINDIEAIFITELQKT